MVSKKSPAATAWKVFIGVFVTLIILILIAELGVRWFLSSQMTKQFGSQATAQGTEDVDVSFGSSPLLLGFIAGEIPEMNLKTPSTLKIEGDSITGQPKSTIHLEGVSLSDPPVARELLTTATLPDEFLLATIQNGIAQQSGRDSLGDVVITDITANAAKDSVEVEFAGGLFNLTLQPEAKDGQLMFHATSSKVLAWELPDAATDQISKALTHGMKDQLSGQSGLEFEKVTVLDGQLEMTMHGSNVNLSELGSQYQELAPAVEDNTPKA